MSETNVLVLNDAEGLLEASDGVRRMREKAHVRVVTTSLSEIPDAELVDVHVLMAVRERSKLGADELDRMPNLRLVLQTGGHAYHLDGAHATARGIPVALGRRGVGPRAAVPELTFALAIGALRHVRSAVDSMAEGEWKPYLGRTLSRRTMGILGFGRHGKSVAKLAHAFGMKVVVWSRTSQELPDGVEALPLDDLLGVSDVVSVHLRLSDESRGLLDAAKLAMMKSGSVLVNTARGAIIDEPALIEALKNGPISAAGLDVFASEPLAPDSELRRLPNVIATPHIGWTVEEVFEEFAEIAADQLEGYLNAALPVDELMDPSVLTT
ncbi:NAD(P)-dependent oxidoreductase [Paramicrobacterium chengjingii]|uniref:NAD(P)-dependent oxidoreductase n=1 Tax=Paramicrobacterium chengjingii TaxID=2769067 RepID=UPI0014223412|nr:NAD(P)-dependent oxidoreductase [Microbacterium chengjingii]